MRDILIARQKSNVLGDLNKEEVDTCAEINELYDLFQSLISNKRFIVNDFMKKEDALAVIDLAEACNMFEG